MTTYRKIKPSSIGSPYKGDYEYLLIWLSPFGGVRQYLFSSTDGRREDSVKYSIVDTIADFRSIPNELDIEIDLMSKSLSRESFDYVASIFESNRILLVNKDATTIPIAISRSKKRTERVIKDFEIEFTIMLQEPDLLNV